MNCQTLTRTLSKLVLLITMLLMELANSIVGSNSLEKFPAVVLFVQYKSPKNKPLVLRKVESVCMRTCTFRKLGGSGPKSIGTDTRLGGYFTLNIQTLYLNWPCFAVSKWYTPL